MNWVFTLAFAVILIYFMKSYLRGKQKKAEFIKPNDTVDERFNAEKQLKQLEIDEILDKVAKKGLESLSVKEKEILDEFSQNN